MQKNLMHLSRYICSFAENYVENVWYCKSMLVGKKKVKANITLIANIMLILFI